MHDIEKQTNLVYAMNGDYYIYRANRYRNTKGKVAIGRVARGGKLLFDTAVSENRRTHPNLDLMALYPDGTMSVHGANGATAQALLDAGARDVLSFGPYLIRDGVINKQGVNNFGVTQQPRAGIGMVRRGHFVHVIVESRTSKSRGVNTAWLADRFELLGCDTAFNLDGGQTAVLIFMGEQLNEIGKYDDKTNSRLQNEIMGIGTMNAP
jgi:exopolysaccharide biosynthesis protein